MSRTDTQPEMRYFQASQQTACKHFSFEHSTRTINLEASSDTASFISIERNKNAVEFYVSTPYIESRPSKRTILGSNVDSETRVRQRFEKLYVAWAEDTFFLSSDTKIVLHPAYQQIIGMGTKVLPLILDKLQKEPNHWFWALKAISGEDPVSSEKAGSMKEMIAIWVNWGKQKGYVAKT